MSLVKCPDCGQDISGHSQFCVHCGRPKDAPLPPPPPPPPPKITIWMVLRLAGVVIGLAGLAALVFGLSATFTSFALPLGLFLLVVAVVGPHLQPGKKPDKPA